MYRITFRNILSDEIIVSREVKNIELVDYTIKKLENTELVFNSIVYDNTIFTPSRRTIYDSDVLRTVMAEIIRIREYTKTLMPDPRFNISNASRYYIITSTDSTMVPATWFSYLFEILDLFIDYPVRELRSITVRDGLYKIAHYWRNNISDDGEGMCMGLDYSYYDLV